MLDLWFAALVDLSLKGFALCLVAGAATLALRRASAASRHLVWRLAFAGLLALPVLATVLPAWRVPFPVQASPTPQRREPVWVTLAPSAVTYQEASVPALQAAEPAPEPGGWRLSWRAVAFGVWLSGALAVLAPLGIALLRLRWQRRWARPIVENAWIEMLDAVRADLGVHRPVELVAGGPRSMPMTWGWRRPVVLLPAGAEAWPEPRRRAVLLHELAHVARRDFLTQLAAEVVRALYWFNPLVWMAAARLRLESEHACDDRVLAAGARATDYAGDLLEIARSLSTVRATATAGLAMARPSQLAGRIAALLDSGRRRRGLSRRLTLPAWLAAACVVLPLAALAPAAAPERSRPAQGAFEAMVLKGLSIFDSRNSQTFEQREDDWKLRIETRGEVKLTADWTRIAHLAPSSTMRIEQEDGRTEKRLVVTAGKGGRPVYRFLVDGRERAFDAAGHRWLEDTLLVFVRGTGYDAEMRFAWFLKHKGPEGVLAEISALPDDYGKKVYLSRLFAYRGLTPGILQRALAQAGREIKSGYILAEALIAAAESQAPAGAAARVYAEAAEAIDGDHDCRRALSALVERGDLSPEALMAVLQSAGKLRSGFERAELLVATASRYTLSGPVRDAYLKAARSIGTGYERERAKAALKRTVT